MAYDVNEYMRAFSTPDRELTEHEERLRQKALETVSKVRRNYPEDLVVFQNRIEELIGPKTLRQTMGRGRFAPNKWEMHYVGRSEDQVRRETLIKRAASNANYRDEMLDLYALEARKEIHHTGKLYLPASMGIEHIGGDLYVIIRAIKGKNRTLSMHSSEKAAKYAGMYRHYLEQNRMKVFRRPSDDGFIGSAKDTTEIYLGKPEELDSYIPPLHNVVVKGVLEGPLRLFVQGPTHQGEIPRVPNVNQGYKMKAAVLGCGDINFLAKQLV